MAKKTVEKDLFLASQKYCSEALEKDTFTREEAVGVLWEICEKNWGGNKYN